MNKNNLEEGCKILDDMKKEEFKNMTYLTNIKTENKLIFVKHALINEQFVKDMIIFIESEIVHYSNNKTKQNKNFIIINRMKTLITQLKHLQFDSKTCLISNQYRSDRMNMLEQIIDNSIMKLSIDSIEIILMAVFSSPEFMNKIKRMMLKYINKNEE